LHHFAGRLYAPAATSDIKPGEIVKMKAGKGGANSTFTVKEVSKDYGACLAAPKP